MSVTTTHVWRRRDRRRDGHTWFLLLLVTLLYTTEAQTPTTGTQTSLYYVQQHSMTDLLYVLMCFSLSVILCHISFTSHSSFCLVVGKNAIDCSCLSGYCCGLYYEWERKRWKDAPRKYLGKDCIAFEQIICIIYAVCSILITTYAYVQMFI